MNADAIMDIFRDGIKRGGTVTVLMANNAMNMADQKHPLLTAELRHDNLIETTTHNDRNIIDPDQVLAVWCRDPADESQMGQYA